MMQVLNKLAVKKDINGNSVLVRVITRRKVESYKPVVPIERLFDTISMHHQHSVGYRGEKKLWNFVSFPGHILGQGMDGNVASIVHTQPCAGGWVCPGVLLMHVLSIKCASRSPALQ